MSKELTKENFDSVVTESEGVVLVDFWAEWCGPCKMMAPIVEELSQEMDGVTIAKVDVDQNQELAMQHNILSIPTFVIYKSGQVVDQFSGALTKEALKERVEKHA
ncbi:thioredoxin [Candidatus Uhrbacteria bacterium RIFCSPLOWO2_02_FULL_53_10]|uniref:Thioredoxin n=1 Tax=Candidatus Uhrbacteria bacterium RIFCSPLOWO2_02_FULL_53_10 TaxID=1802411 RepID=A0A1F7VGT4_9BACT|nr:MAG: thioredoxin [Candidatus Uhrbacteria bacterium RIFCSPLOWO2_02_FULL_53_10]